jgi:hypothetical protein
VTKSGVGLRHASKDKIPTAKSPASSLRGGSVDRGASTDRVSTSKSPASARPTLASTSRAASKSPARPEKSPAKSRASDLAAARMEARKGTSASKLAKPDNSRPGDKSPLKSRIASSSSSSSLKKDTKRPSASSPGLKAMMTKNREQKSFNEPKEDEVEIYVSPKRESKTAATSGGGFDFSEEPPPPPAAVVKPKIPQADPGLEEVFDSPRYFTASARVVVRNNNEASADEVGELSKGDVAKCDMSRGDWLRVVDMVGWHDPEKLLAESVLKIFF